jgi:hypothetical protein
MTFYIEIYIMDIYVCVCIYGPPLWLVRVLDYRSGRPGFDSRHYQIFWEKKKKKKGKQVLGLERGPHSLVSTTEELLDRKVAVPV